MKAILFIPNGNAVFDCYMDVKSYEGPRFGLVNCTTGMTGYQEVLTDPSWKGSLVCFTSVHIGNTGMNDEDMESDFIIPDVIITREKIPDYYSNWRAKKSLYSVIQEKNIYNPYYLDTRALSRHISKHGASTGVVVSYDDFMKFGQDYYCEWMKSVGDKSDSTYFMKSELALKRYGSSYKIAMIDYGTKRSIARLINKHKATVCLINGYKTDLNIDLSEYDGFIFSSGPGNPDNVRDMDVAFVKKVVDSGKPVFGVCFGHQLIAIAYGCKVMRMKHGNHAINHPILHITTGKTFLASQNHNYVVDSASIPETVEQTHISLLDNSNQGLRIKGKPVYSMQYHSEGSPGPKETLQDMEFFMNLVHSHAEKK